MLLHRVVDKSGPEPAEPSPVSMVRLLAAEAIATHFQPIFSVRQKSIVGLEALSRGMGSNGRLIAPCDLFKMAAAERLRGELEALCRKTAVRCCADRASRRGRPLLFLNL